MNDDPIRSDGCLSVVVTAEQTVLHLGINGRLRRFHKVIERLLYDFNWPIKLRGGMTINGLNKSTVRITYSMENAFRGTALNSL